MFYEIVTFDCYGTLVDWNTGIREAFARASVVDGVEVDVDELRADYADLEPLVQSERYLRYRDVLSETARKAAARVGWHMDARTARAFASSIAEWRTFRDTNPALERLRGAGIRLGILSNVDRDLLAGTLGHMTVPFDLIVTAEDVGSYKPAPAHFLEASRRIGGASWLHAAQSYFHDVAPTYALGIPSAWINRHCDVQAGDAKPVAEFATLTELADWLAPARSTR
jgi:2-haloacid dehalogenase/putative hydrolase of the HAD superfamily